MTEPTQEQIKKFWERCGLGCTHEWQFIEGKTPLWGMDCQKCGKEFRRSQWSHAVAPVIGKLTNYPPLDLNNLFKFAVPQARNKVGADDLARRLAGWMKDVILCGLNPETSLFWVIREVMKDD